MKIAIIAGMTTLATAFALSSGFAMAQTDFNHETRGMARTSAFHNAALPNGISSRRMPGSTVGIGPGNRSNDTNVYIDGQPRGDVYWAPTTHGG